MYPHDKSSCKTGAKGFCKLGFYLIETKLIKKYKYHNQATLQQWFNKVNRGNTANPHSSVENPLHRSLSTPHVQ